VNVRLEVTAPPKVSVFRLGNIWEVARSDLFGGIDRLVGSGVAKIEGIGLNLFSRNGTDGLLTSLRLMEINAVGHCIYYGNILKMR
jgi:hypothetical protein